MRKNWLAKQRGADAPAVLLRIMRQHPDWPRTKIKKAYRQRTGRGGADWMTDESARAKAKLNAADGEVRRLTQAQEARRT